MPLLQIYTTQFSTSIPCEYTCIKLKQSDNICVDLTVDRPRDRNYKIRKFKNTYTQDKRCR